MNVLDKLNSFFKHGEEAEKTEKELKAERVKFHREHVRNGPVKFPHVTNGQIRRFEARTVRRQQKKAYRGQVKTYFKQQRLAATVRAHLQAAGVLPYFGAHAATAEQAAYSVQWLVARYAPAPEDGSGVVEVTEALVLTALKDALNDWETIVGMPRTKLRSDYVLPVALPA